MGVGLPRNYSHITEDDISHGIKYHVSQDDRSRLSYLQQIIDDIHSITDLTTIIEATVGPTESVMVDTFPGDEFFACDWYLAIIDSTRMNMRSSTVKAVWNYLTNNVEIDETFTYIGDFSKMEFFVDMVSGHVRLFVINTGPLTWSIQGRREFI